MNYINSGAVSPDEIRNVLREDTNSAFNALEGDAPNDPIDFDPDNDSFNDNAATDDEWNEADHPRKQNGQFGEGGANTNQSKETAPKDIKELLGDEIKGVKGQEAINTLLEKKKGHVKAAFNRSDTGPIDLIWGDDKKGLCHIVKQREAQNIDIKSFLSDLSEVIEKGDMRISPDRGNFELLYNGKMAIVAPTLENNKITFLLTAFKTSRKKHKK